jgi:hypothetical protein
MGFLLNRSGPLTQLSYGFLKRIGCKYYYKINRNKYPFSETRQKAANGLKQSIKWLFSGSAGGHDAAFRHSRKSFNPCRPDKKKLIYFQDCIAEGDAFIQ